MAIPMYQVDAFSERPFGGNPAAVCVMDEVDRDDQWLQKVAIENNLSETAFVRRQGDAYELRWFTPAFEVDLCGHATLATAHALWESERHPIDSPIGFDTRSGRLTITREGSHIVMDFPAVRAEACDAPDGLIESLGIEPKFVGTNQMDFLVEVDSESALHEMQPDFGRLGRVSLRGVMVTCRSQDSDFDFKSRFFAPAAGIDEDPVTGSAHCCLGPYWQSKTGRDEFRALQGSSRQGVVQVAVRGDRVLLKGQAVTVLRGEMLV